MADARCTDAFLSKVFALSLNLIWRISILSRQLWILPFCLCYIILCGMLIAQILLIILKTIWKRLSHFSFFNSSSALLRYSSQCVSLSQTCSQHHSPIQGLCHASTSVCLEYVTNGCALCLTSHQDQLEYTMSQYKWWALWEVPIEVQSDYVMHHWVSCYELNWIYQVAHVWEWNMYLHPAGPFPGIIQPTQPGGDAGVHY